MLLDDDGKLFTKISNKKSNARKEGLSFQLSFSYICYLLKEAGISSSKWNIKEYHLSRYNDLGNYTEGNCRFIPGIKNYQERVVSDSSRRASSENIKKENLSKGHSNRVRDGIKSSLKWKLYQKRRYEESIYRKSNKISHPSYSGNKNSQFGSFWITNGTKNMKWREENGDIPVGFIKGRSPSR